MIGTHRVTPVDKILGSRVVNSTGENMGKIENLAMDMDRGCIAYAVLSFGGIMGMGSKYFAIPWQAFALAPTGEEFLLNVEKQRLENAEGFDKDRWPNMADQRWATNIHSYYGVTPYWER